MGEEFRSSPKERISRIELGDEVFSDIDTQAIAFEGENASAIAEQEISAIN